MALHSENLNLWLKALKQAREMIGNLSKEKFVSKTHKSHY